VERFLHFMECLDSARWAFQQNPLLDLPRNVFEFHEINAEIEKVGISRTKRIHGTSSTASFFHRIGQKND